MMTLRKEAIAILLLGVAFVVVGSVVARDGKYFVSSRDAECLAGGGYYQTRKDRSQTGTGCESSTTVCEGADPCVGTDEKEKTGETEWICTDNDDWCCKLEDPKKCAMLYHCGKDLSLECVRNTANKETIKKAQNAWHRQRR